MTSLVRRGAWCVVVPALILYAARSADAQDTREAQIVREQAAKATQLQPYRPTRAERWIGLMEKALGGPPVGVYPWLGSILPGGLFSIGPGVRLPFAARGAFDAQAAVSLRNYKLARATLTLPPMADRRVLASVHAQVIDAPSVSFYGIGNDTPKQAKTTFLYRPKEVGGTMDLAVLPHVQVGARLTYLDVTNGGGRRGTSIENRFDAGTAPAFQVNPRYVIGGGYAMLDWREAPGYSRHGGSYRIDWSAFHETQSQPYSFQRVDLDARQLIPLLRGNWVVALHAAASTTSTDAGERVPFFLLPQLGGGSELRGYPVFRFRDQHRLLFGAEYRWMPSNLIDMALFTDVGKVAARRADLNLHGLKHTYGVGVRIHGPAATYLRLEVALSAERTAIVMASRQVF